MNNETKVYRVINEQGVYEYDIHVKKTKKGMSYKLYTSSRGDWAENYRNEKLLSILDTGDGIKTSCFMKDMDYSKTAELYILLSFIQQTISIYKGSIVEVIEEHITFI